MVAADAGVGHAHRLPGAAEAGGDLGEVEAVGRAGEGGAEAAVLALAKPRQSLRRAGGLTQALHFCA